MNSTRGRRGWDEPPKDAAAATLAEGLGTLVPATGVAGLKSGRVKAWFDEQGFGFIMQDDGSEDLFVHRSALTDGNLLVLGSPVLYDVVWNDRQQKHMAAQLSGASNPVSAGISSGCGDGGALAAALPPGRKGGRVKAWFEDQGFGFIMQDDGSEDLFVHRSALTDGNLLLVGAPVAYEVVWNEQKSKNLASNLTGASSPVQAGIATTNGWSAATAARNHAQGAILSHVAGAAGGRKSGRVKAWIEEKGFGFILQDDGEEDLFVHRSALRDGGSLVVGTTVLYISEWNDRKQKYLAQDVSGAVPQDSYGKGMSLGMGMVASSGMISNGLRGGSGYGGGFGGGYGGSSGGYGRAPAGGVGGAASRYDPYGGGVGLNTLGALAGPQLSRTGGVTSFKEFEALYDAQEAAAAAAAAGGQYDQYGEQSFFDAGNGLATDPATAAGQYDIYGEQSFWGVDHPEASLTPGG